jgi:hypothetical protein
VTQMHNSHCAQPDKAKAARSPDGRGWFRGATEFRSIAYLSRFLITSFVLMSATGGQAQSPIAEGGIAARPALEQVVDTLIAKNAERTTALQRYQSRRFYRLIYTGFPTSLKGEMVVDMLYEAPASKQFTIVSQSGPKWMVERVFKGLLQAEQEALNSQNRERVALNRHNYEFTGMEFQEASDGCSYVISVKPKSLNKLLYRGRIWVNSRDFAVCRIEAEPAKNPSFWIKNTAVHHIYQKLGDFWFPLENESTSTMRVGGRAVLSIKYSNYEILAARPLQRTDTQRTDGGAPAPIASASSKRVD